MYNTITHSTFRDAFMTSDTYKNNFTWDGLTALFNYIEELEEDIDQRIEFDMVAIACEYSEYKNLKELQENYKDIDTMEELEEHTIVIPIDEDAFIIQDY